MIYQNFYRTFVNFASITKYYEKRNATSFVQKKNVLAFFIASYSTFSLFNFVSQKHYNFQFSFCFPNLISVVVYFEHVEFALELIFTTSKKTILNGIFLHKTPKTRLNKTSLLSNLTNQNKENTIY